MSTFNKKFHAPEVEHKLKHSQNNIWFGLKSGIIFDRHEFLLVGDSMDTLAFNYEVSSTLRDSLLKFEGHTLYYRNQGTVRKMTLSIQEISFLKQYIEATDELVKVWDWEEITDM